MKCRFRKKCPCFSGDSRVCMKDGGMYYGLDRPAGCYRDMERKLRIKGSLVKGDVRDE